jgi:homogentisate 1,2-dioxygenase
VTGPAAGARQRRRPLSYVVAGEASPLYRNATGDECVFVEAGTATVETVFGHLDVHAGDYVVLPRATTHRWVPHEPLRAYVVEANGHLAPPKRYLSKHGQFLEHAPYCERDLRVRPRRCCWTTGTSTCTSSTAPGERSWAAS